MKQNILLGLPNEIFVISGPILQNFNLSKK